MAKVRQIIGHVKVEIAQRKRKCHRNQKEHSIPAATPCLVISSSQDKKNYCPICAREIINRAYNDLENLENQLFDQHTKT